MPHPPAAPEILPSHIDDGCKAIKVLCRSHHSPDATLPSPRTCQPAPPAANQTLETTSPPPSCCSKARIHPVVTQTRAARFRPPCSCIGSRSCPLSAISANDRAWRPVSELSPAFTGPATLIFLNFLSRGTAPPFRRQQAGSHRISLAPPPSCNSTPVQSSQSSESPVMIIPPIVYAFGERR